MRQNVNLTLAQPVGSHLEELHAQALKQAFFHLTLQLPLLNQIEMLFPSLVQFQDCLLNLEKIPPTALVSQDSGQGISKINANRGKVASSAGTNVNTPSGQRSGIC